MPKNLAIVADNKFAEQLVNQLKIISIPAINSLTHVNYIQDEEAIFFRFNQKTVKNIQLEMVNWLDYDVVLFAGNTSHARHIADAVEKNCKVIDINGVCANLNSIPIVLPAINDHLISNSIVSLPNPQITQAIFVISSLINEFTINSISINSLLSASYFNENRVNQLAKQTIQLLNGVSIDDDQQIAFDINPIKDIEYTNSQNLYHQMNKILNLENVNVHLQQTAVPVFYGLSQLISIAFEKSLVLDKITEVWNKSEFICYYTDDKILTPVKNSKNEDSLQQIHISNIEIVGNKLQFFSVADEHKFSKARIAIELLSKL